MKDENSNSDWDKEYQIFLASQRSSPPAHLTSHSKNMVSRELNPSHFLVFAKLFAIHLISGTLTLFLCPQFGVASPLKENFLFKAFLFLGDYGCMLACGSLFLGATALASVICLRAPEIRAIRNSRGLQWAFLALISVGFFLSFREQESAVPAGLIVTWFAGALVGGVSVFQVADHFRSRMSQARQLR